MTKIEYRTAVMYQPSTMSRLTYIFSNNPTLWGRILKVPLIYRERVMQVTLVSVVANVEKNPQSTVLHTSNIISTMTPQKAYETLVDERIIAPIPSCPHYTIMEAYRKIITRAADVDPVTIRRNNHWVHHRVSNEAFNTLVRHEIDDDLYNMLKALDEQQLSNDQMYYIINTADKIYRRYRMNL